jgi:hypothetical protein
LVEEGLLFLGRAAEEAAMGRQAYLTDNQPRVEEGQALALTRAPTPDCLVGVEAALEHLVQADTRGVIVIAVVLAAVQALPARVVAVDLAVAVIQVSLVVPE